MIRTHPEELLASLKMQKMVIFNHFQAIYQVTDVDQMLPKGLRVISRVSEMKSMTFGLPKTVSNVFINVFFCRSVGAGGVFPAPRRSEGAKIGYQRGVQGARMRTRCAQPQKQPLHNQAHNPLETHNPFTGKINTKTCSKGKCILKCLQRENQY